MERTAAFTPAQEGQLFQKLSPQTVWLKTVGLIYVLRPTFFPPLPPACQTKIQHPDTNLKTRSKMLQRIWPEMLFGGESCSENIRFNCRFWNVLLNATGWDASLIDFSIFQSYFMHNLKMYIKRKTKSSRMLIWDVSAHWGVIGFCRWPLRRRKNRTFVTIFCTKERSIKKKIKP